MPRTSEISTYCHCEFEGKQVNTITVRGFKNKDRKLLGVYEDNINAFLVYFVANCIVAIDGKPIDNSERKKLFVKQMERGDIFNAFYEIKKITKNSSKVKIQGRCRFCADMFSTEINTDDLERIENKEEKIHLILPEGLERTVNGQKVIHKDLVMRKPTGNTIIKMGEYEDIFESIQRGCVSCIERIGEIENVSYYDLDDLEYADVQAIEKSWAEGLGGVVTQVKLRCPKCRKTFEAEMLIQDFFD